MISTAHALFIYISLCFTTTLSRYVTTSLSMGGRLLNVPDRVISCEANPVITDSFSHNNLPGGGRGEGLGHCNNTIRRLKGEEEGV